MSFKVGGLKEKSATIANTVKVCMQAHLAQIQVRPVSNYSQSLMVNHLAAFWPTDTILPVWKDLNPLKIHISFSRDWKHF